jgi:UDP-N-acetyl-D-glucosamine dehydrogenase
VAYADPYVPSVELQGTILKAVDLTDEELVGADCVVILTDHPQFDWGRVVDRARLLVDARNATVGLSCPADRVVRL